MPILPFISPTGLQRCARRHRQGGDFLMEAIIGMALMAIIGVGVMQVTGRIQNSQRDMALQDLAVKQMRELLMKHDDGSQNLCAAQPPTISLPGETITLTVNGCTTASVTLDGVVIANAKKPLVLTATSSSLGTVTLGGAPSQ